MKINMDSKFQLVLTELGNEILKKYNANLLSQIKNEELRKEAMNYISRSVGKEVTLSLATIIQIFGPYIKQDIFAHDMECNKERFSLDTTVKVKLSYNTLSTINKKQEELLKRCYNSKLKELVKKDFIKVDILRYAEMSLKDFIYLFSSLSLDNTIESDIEIVDQKVNCPEIVDLKNKRILLSKKV